MAERMHKDPVVRRISASLTETPDYRVSTDLVDVDEGDLLNDVEDEKKILGKETIMESFKETQDLVKQSQEQIKQSQEQMNHSHELMKQSQELMKQF